jgi:glycosyltransferase involved in cell wall biosynthesis
MAFQQVLSVHPHARLLLVGGVESLALPAEQATKYWNKLHKLVADLNLDKIVHISGYLPADTASRYIAGSDFGVLPFNCGVTIKSGSLLTMLAHGLPVVATHHDPDSK